MLENQPGSTERYAGSSNRSWAPQVLWQLVVSLVGVLTGCGDQVDDASRQRAPVESPVESGFDSSLPTPSPPMAQSGGAPNPAGGPTVEDAGSFTSGGQPECSDIFYVDGDVAGIKECSGVITVQDISGGCPGGGGGESAYIAGDSTCSTNADCPKGAKCLGTQPNRWCRYPGVCTTNGDCATGEACFCGIDVLPAAAHDENECLPAACETDKDCGGFPCRVSIELCVGFAGSFCHGPDDECRGADDCGDGYCRYDRPESRWVCQPWHTCR
jgi:hypothetical protein